VTRRTIRTTPVPAGVRFPHAKQVLVLDRHTTDLAGGHPQTEICYGITSLDAARAGPARLASLVRGQWTIENRLHWVRDVTFDDYAEQVIMPRSRWAASLSVLTGLSTGRYSA